MVCSPRGRPALCTDLALFAIKCVNENSAFLQVERESKLCIRNTAVLLPVLFPIVVIQ